MVHTEDRVDPVADLEIIHHELRQKDIERMEKLAEGLSKVSSGVLLLQSMQGGNRIRNPSGDQAVGRHVVVSGRALLMSCSRGGKPATAF